MFLLIYLSTSIHVPYSVTSQQFIDFIDGDTLQTLIQEKEMLIPIVVSDDDMDSEFLIKYAELSIEFSDKAVFVAVRNSEADFLNMFGSPELPYIAEIKNHSVKVVLPLRKNIDTITILIRNWVNGPMKVDDLEEFAKVVGGCQFTVIAKKENYNEAAELIESLYRPYGVIDIIIASDALFCEFGLDKSKFGLFRLMDNVITPFSDISEFFDVVKPLYNIINDDDLNNNLNVTYAAIFGKSFQESYHDIFYSLSLKYPEFSFVLMPEKYFNYYTAALKIEPAELSFLIFNFDLGYFYYPPTNSTFNEYLEDVKIGKIEKSYFSEKINDDNNDFLSQKVVGVDYEDFVNEKIDVLMLYTDDPIPFVSLLEELSTKFSKDLRIKFGYINPKLNSSPKTLPKYIKLPHFELFPRNDKENSIPFFGELSINALIRFLKNNCVNGNQINISGPEFDEMVRDYQDVSKIFYDLPTSLRPKARKYLDELMEKIIKAREIDN